MESLGYSTNIHITTVAFLIKNYFYLFLIGSGKHQTYIYYLLFSATVDFAVRLRHSC